LSNCRLRKYFPSMALCFIFYFLNLKKLKITSQLSQSHLLHLILMRLRQCIPFTRQVQK
jgi:hypothetical protein